MHLKVIWKLKKPKKLSLLAKYIKKTKNPKKPHKNQNNPNNPEETQKSHWAGFFLNPGFFQPCLYLVALTGQGHVEKVPVVPEVLEGVADISLEVVPFEAEFLLFRHLYLIK